MGLEKNVNPDYFLRFLNDSDISHEIRTPLTVIKGFVELLLNSNNLDLMRQNLQIILQNEARSESVIQNFEKNFGDFRKNLASSKS